jgi:hypothetical protein
MNIYRKIYSHVNIPIITYMYTYTGWGDSSWTKLFFFNVYRPSCLFEAYGRPKNYWLVYVGLLANRLFNQGAFFSL